MRIRGNRDIPVFHVWHLSDQYYVHFAAPRTIAVSRKGHRGKSGRLRAARLVNNKGRTVQVVRTESAAENIPPWVPHGSG